MLWFGFNPSGRKERKKTTVSTALFAIHWDNCRMIYSMAFNPLSKKWERREEKKGRAIPSFAGALAEAIPRGTNLVRFRLSAGLIEEKKGGKRGKGRKEGNETRSQEFLYHSRPRKIHRSLLTQDPFINSISLNPRWKKDDGRGKKKR